MREYVESVLRRKKLIPYKPYIRGKQVESILGTHRNMTKKVFNLKKSIPHSVRLVDPLIRKPFPIPKVSTVLQELEGFTFATALDLNMGYYTIRLDPDASRI
jgi:hypothetical protein